MNIRVLIADPEQELVNAYRDYLASEEFEVETVTRGEHCVNRIKNWKPDVLVLEPDMQDGWGEIVLDAAHAQRPELPVLVLSRCDADRTDDRVHEYHVNPFPMLELARRIRTAASR